MKSPLLTGSSEAAPENTSKQDGKTITIRIASPGQPLLQIEISPDDTVAKLQELIETKREGMPKARQRIIFFGRELPQSKILSADPNPVMDGATLHLALRPEARIRRMSMAGDRDPASPGYQPEAEQDNNELPMAVELVAQEIMYVQVMLNRSSRYTKAIGVGFTALSFLILLRGATDSSWGTLATGGSLFAVGLAGVQAGRNESTCTAATYYYGLWSFMVFLAVLLSIPYVVEDVDANNQTTYMSILLLLVALPFLLCSPCAFCARQHYRNCMRRDALLHQLDIVGDDIPYDALV